MALHLGFQKFLHNLAGNRPGSVPAGENGNVPILSLDFNWRL